MVVLSSFSHPTEGIRLQQRNTTAYQNNIKLGKGTLYIAESQLSWIGSSGDGFSIPYPNISLHAISRDLNAFPEECLFLMLDIEINGPEEEKLEMDDGDDDSDVFLNITELRFVPEDRGMLDAMFHALSACQALHPDPQDSFSDEDFYEDADEDVPVDETNSQMANLCIERDSVSGMCVAAGTEEGMAEGMVEGTAEGMVEVCRGQEVFHRVAEGSRGLVLAEGALGCTQTSSEHMRIYSCHRDQGYNCSDTGCFDDADN